MHFQDSIVFSITVEKAPALFERSSNRPLNQKPANSPRTLYRRSCLWPPRSINQHVFFFILSDVPDQLHLGGSNELLLVFVRGIAIEHHGENQSAGRSVGGFFKKRSSRTRRRCVCVVDIDVCDFKKALVWLAGEEWRRVRFVFSFFLN